MAPITPLPAPAVSVATAPALPTGAVRLLTHALMSTNPRLWWVCRLRALHAAWMLRGVAADRARIIVARDGDDLVGVALSIRYDARPAPRHVGRLVLHALVLGVLLELLAAVVPPPLVLGGLFGLAAFGVAGAALLDGPDGRAGARSAQQRAATIGPDRSWGRGLVAVAATHRGAGVGTDLTRTLLSSLPDGHSWLPVALTPRAGSLYARLGAHPLDGAASELRLRPAAGLEVGRAA